MCVLVVLLVLTSELGERKGKRDTYMSCDDVDNDTLPRLLYLQSTEQAVVGVSLAEYSTSLPQNIAGTQDPNVSVFVIS